MAEMAIFMLDQTNPEGIEKTTKLPQRGDVITVHDDGWQWGSGEIGNPLFVIVSVPDATPADLSSFLSPEVPQEPLADGDTWANPNNTLQYRGFKVDVDAYVPPPGGDILREGTTTTVPLDTIMSLKVAKSPIPDPKIIGDSGKVIG